MNEAQCLAYDPFAGDRDSDARGLRDKFVHTRKPHTCVICWENIPPRSRVRALTEFSREERKAMTFYFCELCCAAMAHVNNDDGKRLEERTRIGMKKAGSLPINA